ncbi:hypothetical protein [Desulfoscipio gibsoniae]|uniref:FlgD Ig-like domain-containing protein n=1 Tax=Desulfoscipio gibsoniae DSM 7213 TaxID=767817 RepID=R4KP22_9FIRM|nr:hypothetical protein [Desulfoscipio gibsoniae]AGL03312.1 hypothetical protein Desgi_4038 [Desulfoscipio gibsoniae DSM 7213]
MKKFIYMGIFVLMAVFLIVPAYAVNGTKNVKTEELIAPQFTYISLLSPGLSINSSGKATCVGLASAYNSSHTTKLTVELQKSTDSGWSTIKTWSASATGVSIADIEEDYYVVRGTYRVCATAKVYNTSGNLLETQSLYSTTSTY